MYAIIFHLNLTVIEFGTKITSLGNTQMFSDIFAEGFYLQL